MQRWAALERLMTKRLGTRGMVGAPDDLVAFCDRHYDGIVGALSLYCGDGDLARELAQEALARACREWERVRGMGNPSGWAYRVGINVANSHFRRRRAEGRALRRDAARHRSQSHRDPDAGDRVAVRRAVAALPKQMRTALVLRFYADMPTAEIADHMGVKEASVRATVHRAVAALGETLGIDDLDLVEEATDAH